MNLIYGLAARTVLEHAVFLSGRSVVEVCRELGITPQQFTDWIKGRRPVPEERLSMLSRYFHVPEEMLADERRFARKLSNVNALELELVICGNTPLDSPEEKEEMLHRIKTLEAEKQKQVRIARLAAVLDKGDGGALSRIDALLDELEMR